MINPNLSTNLKSDLAQGHNVGDIDVGPDNIKYRWSGASWEREPTHMQSAAIQSQDPMYMAQQALKFQQEANKPAIASYEAAIPEVTQKYATQRTAYQGQIEPLKQRYQSLLDEIKGIYGTQINRQTLATGREMGKRGVLPSSGLFERELNLGLEPIASEQAAKVQQTGLAQEADIRDIQNAIAALTPAETAELRSITNAIAQLQSGAGASALSSGLSYAGLAQQQQQQAESNRLAQLTYELGEKKQSWEQSQANFNRLIELAKAYA